jgi:hypothetical protein
MPLPSIAEWEWLNWKFPRPVKAGDTIYARWTLTQKRPPVGSAPTAIVVWRVDVHTADGALCAEGEVGASVRRHGGAVRAIGQEVEAAAAPAPASRRRRRRRSSNGAKPPSEAAAPAVEATVVASPAVSSTAERAPGSPRRRRRRRSPGSPPARKGEAASPAAPDPDPPAPAAAAASSAQTPPNAISRVIRRLRRT